MMASGALVRVLIHTDVIKYLNFKVVDGIFMYNKGKVHKVPANDVEVLTSPLMGLFEKLRARKFFLYVQDFEESDPKTHDGMDLNSVIAKYLISKYGLEDNTVDFIGHALALHQDDNYLEKPALDFVKRMKVVLRAITNFMGVAGFIVAVIVADVVSFSRLSSMRKMKAENALVRRPHVLETMALCTDVLCDKDVLTLNQADVHRRTLSEMKTLSFLDTKGTNSRSLVIIQDSILRQLQDNDLTVFRAALSLDSLSTFLNPSDLVEVLDHLLRICMGLLTSSQENNSLACDVAILCLKNVVSVHRNSVYCDKLATLIFPLLLVLPKRLNLKAANAVSWVNWPLFENLASLNTEQTLQPGSFSSINMGTITSLASTLLLYSQFAMPWFVESSRELELSTTHIYLVMMQSVLTEKESAKSLELFEVLFPALKSEWELFESTCVHVEDLKTEMLNWECRRFIDNLDSNLKARNANILVCIFWRLIESFLSYMHADAPSWERKGGLCYTQEQIDEVRGEWARHVTMFKI